MPVDARILELVNEVIDSNRSPEEVCADCPELLREVQRQWKRFSRMNSELEALFPSADSTSFGSATEKRAACVEGEFPRLPGYEVESVLGHGGMGMVYKARHLRLNRPVALKMMIYGACAMPHELERFQREAEAVAGLRHPNIIQIYDVGDIDGRPYFTIEFVEGGTLANKLAGNPQGAADAAAMAATVAEAVQAAHDGGIVHRDLKPSNILLTDDGTLKISDFGLARRFSSEVTPTLSAAMVGTPSYMAPEQALGKSSAFCPSVDVYALGALLYEMLTGRPPFRAETVAETQRQVVEEEPAAPSRLNATVPRDLETICLKCLSKDATSRYATAAEVASDLYRYQRGEPISARRPTFWERVNKWVRRRPAAAGLIAASLLLCVTLVGSALSLWSQRQHEREAIEADLREVNLLEQQAKWPEARTVLQRASERVMENGGKDLLRRLNQSQHDLDLVIELDRIRLSRVTGGNLPYYRKNADQQYMTAFSKANLLGTTDRPDVIAVRVNASAVRSALVAALDDWAGCAVNMERRKWLLEVARDVSPNASGWGDRVRDPTAWGSDRTMISDWSRTMPLDGQSVSLLLALGERLPASNDCALTFLKRVQAAYPTDFWTNLTLGDALLKNSPQEAAGFYRATVASRPQAAVAYTALGDALKDQKKKEEALAYYREAVRIDAKYARGQTNLGNLLNEMGNASEAIECYKRALKGDPHYAWAHFDWAKLLKHIGQEDESLEHFAAFYAAAPLIWSNAARTELIRHGRSEEVQRVWKKALEEDPSSKDSWFGYADLCLFVGREDDYRDARKSLLRKFRNTRDPYVAEPLARAVLLSPSSEDDLNAAVALADLAVSSKSTTQADVYPYFLFAKGLANYRRGEFEGAASIMSTSAAGVLGPCPRFILAMAKQRLGHGAEARKILAAAIADFDWDLTAIHNRDEVMWRVFRREAEATVR